MDARGVLTSADNGRGYSERTISDAMKLREFLLVHGEARGAEICEAVGIGWGQYFMFIHAATHILQGLYETDDGKLGINRDLERGKNGAFWE